MQTRMSRTASEYWRNSKVTKITRVHPKMHQVVTQIMYNRITAQMADLAGSTADNRARESPANEPTYQSSCNDLVCNNYNNYRSGRCKLMYSRNLIEFCIDFTSESGSCAVGRLSEQCPMPNFASNQSMFCLLSQLKISLLCVLNQLIAIAHVFSLCHLAVFRLLLLCYGYGLRPTVVCATLFCFMIQLAKIACVFSCGWPMWTKCLSQCSSVVCSEFAKFCIIKRSVTLMAETTSMRAKPFMKSPCRPTEPRSEGF